jgi:hypothetical protein
MSDALGLTLDWDLQKPFGRGGRGCGIISVKMRLLQNTSQNVLKIGPVYTGQLV